MGRVAAPVYRRLSRLDRDLGQERGGVERVVAEARRDLFARRFRALAEELAQQLARLGAPPPVFADRVDQVPAQLRGADPCAQVVRRVEAGVHVREITVAAVADPGCFGQELLVAARRAAVVGETRPEPELIAELGLVPTEEQ